MISGNRRGATTGNSWKGGRPSESTRYAASSHRVPVGIPRTYSEGGRFVCSIVPDCSGQTGTKWYFFARGSEIARTGNRRCSVSVTWQAMPSNGARHRIEGKLRGGGTALLSQGQQYTVRQRSTVLGIGIGGGMPTSVLLDACIERLIRRLSKRLGHSKAELIRTAIESLARGPSTHDRLAHILGVAESGGRALSQRTGSTVPTPADHASACPPFSLTRASGLS